MKKCCISYCLAYSTAVRYGPIIILAYGVKVFGNVLYGESRPRANEGCGIILARDQG